MISRRRGRIITDRRTLKSFEHADGWRGSDRPQFDSIMHLPLPKLDSNRAALIAECCDQVLWKRDRTETIKALLFRASGEAHQICLADCGLTFIKPVIENVTTAVFSSFNMLCSR